MPENGRKRRPLSIVIIVLLLVCILLSGCGNNVGKEMLKEAKELHLYSISNDALQDNYGVPAYGLLTYIQSEYPGRIAGTEKEKETALFILSVLLNGGYSEEEISVKQFSIPDSVPSMAEPITLFDGGEKTNSSQNIEVIKRGESEKTIVVGAHYDSAGTHGVDDNGSGLSVVLENALRMYNTQTHYTIRYVFFGAEEVGIWGSKAYVDSLSEKEKENLVLMINVDSILAGDYLYIYGGHINESCDVEKSEAVFKAEEIAHEIGLEIQLPPEGNSDYPYPTGQKRSDHGPFDNIGIPYIYFEANNWDSGSPEETKKNGLIMHTALDDLVFIENEYGERAQNTLTSYSTLLYYLLLENAW